EISTDKVDSEIPSPATGRIVEILIPEGQTVPIQTVLAIIETEGEEVKGDIPLEKTPSDAFSTAPERPPARESSPHDASDAGGIQVREFRKKVASGGAAPTDGKEREIAATPQKTSTFLSPLVQRIAAEEGVTMEELNSLVGTGEGGRVTKKDLLDYIERKKKGVLQPPPIAKEEVKEIKRPVSATSTLTAPPPTISRPETAPVSPPPPVVPTPEPVSPEVRPPISVWMSPGDQVVEMDRMRRAIADHMVRSKQISPHVFSFAEVDMTRVVKHRESIKESFRAKEGLNITYTSYFIWAAAKVLPEFPYINASVDGYNIVLRKSINIGFAVELPGGGLIVPVLKNVDTLSLYGIAKGLHDLAERARSGRLEPQDVSGGTFTITNVGVFGNIAGAPIINQPQVAILGTGAIKKRPVVVETGEGDFIAIKPMMMISLSYDHRLIDGAYAGRFMQRFARILEEFEE
ncbi:MAG: dihydrolipoamide acetyltransferase family protein, partial [bacterium]